VQIRNIHGVQKGGRLREEASDRSDQIVQLLTNVQQQLTRCVRTLVPNRADADEVLQETNLFIWRHADEFELGSNFAAWACKIAHYQVLTYRKRQARGRLRFSDRLVEQLAAVASRTSAGQSDDAAAFESCVERLPSSDRELLDLRYEIGATVQSVARQVGRSVKAVYNSLARIRTSLLECMDRARSERRRG
jgi:RNA polymerase sigma-70 factor, ECF subfamily